MSGTPKNDLKMKLKVKSYKVTMINQKHTEKKIVEVLVNVILASTNW